MESIAYINDLINEIEIFKNIRDHSIDKIDTLNTLIDEKEKLLEQCKTNLSKLSNNQIEYKLYLKMLNGKTASQAVSEVADENYMNDIKPSSLSSLWVYYKNMQKILKQE